MDDNPFILGIDLGQAQDYTALVIVEVKDIPHEDDGQYISSIKASERVTHYTVRYLERFRLGTPYPQIVNHIASLLREPELGGQTDLVVDRTGVGAPVCDILDQAGLEFAGITITGGDTVSEENNHYRVPKRDLVSIVQVLQQTQRLKVVPGLPEAQTLMQEMQAFRMKINPETMHDSYGAWREGNHDDLLLALAIACWYGENRPEPWEFW